MGVEEFFADNNIPFSKQPVAGLEGKGVLYQSNDGMCALYCCDLYDFNEHIHGQFDAIWDRFCPLALVCDGIVVSKGRGLRVGDWVRVVGV